MYDNFVSNDKFANSKVDFWVYSIQNSFQEVSLIQIKVICLFFLQNFIIKKIKEGWLEPEKILFIAAHHNHRRVFQALWPLIEDKNPQLSLPQPSSTPLHIAAKHGYTKLVRDIIDQDLEEKNPSDEVWNI